MHKDKLGFDNIGLSFLTEFQITVMDDWPELVMPISNADSPANWVARPLFILLVVSVSMLTVNLFLASMTYSFLSVRQENRGEHETLALFKEMDKDGDGLLNRKEVKDLAEKLGHNLNEEEIDKAMAEMDDDNSGAGNQFHRYQFHRYHCIAFFHACSPWLAPQLTTMSSRCGTTSRRRARSHCRTLLARLSRQVR